MNLLDLTTEELAEAFHKAEGRFTDLSAEQLKRTLTIAECEDKTRAYEMRCAVEREVSARQYRRQTSHIPSVYHLTQKLVTS